MRSTFSRAPQRSAARSDLLERQFRRYCPRYQGAVRALAARHPRVADLAASFPTLLFALAVPRPGLDPARAIGRAIAGAPLAEVAAAADLPFWLRKLPPEAPTRPIAKLPDGKAFRRRIANHLPSRKLAPVWLQAVADMADLAHDAGALWLAREITRQERPKLDRLRLIGLWAWFSSQPGTFGHGMIETPWTPAMRLAVARGAADDWRTTFTLYLDLGREPVAEPWLKPAHVCGYDFLPLMSAEQIVEEASAMNNCVRTYGDSVAHNQARLWSIRRQGERVATLSIEIGNCDPLPTIGQVKAWANGPATVEVSWAARQWLHMHDLPRLDTKRRQWGTVPFDRATWLALWRPYWLAKRRIPDWLPLMPSRAAVDAL
jgi:hypothetical protein